MCGSVVIRLVNINVHFWKDDDLARSTFRQYLVILARLIRLLPKCEMKSVFTRLVLCRSIVGNFEDIHAEIDYLLRGTALEGLDIVGANWRKSWESNGTSLLQAFQSVLGNERRLLQNLGDTLDQVETMALLRNELSVRGDQYDAELLGLLAHAYETAQRSCTSLSVEELPRWFLSVHELDLDEAAPQSTAETTVSALCGTWLSSAVTICKLDVPSETFRTEVDKWFPLSHPNLIKLFGASHLRSPFTAVFENVVSTNLCKYLAVGENRHLLWSKLYEMALGLKYLHERGVVLGNLQCSNIWIGTDGLAKISGLGANSADKQSGSEQRGVRWKSPECLKGEATTAASDIYSFGICIVEALSGSIPWSDKGDAAKLASLITFGHRP